MHPGDLVIEKLQHAVERRVVGEKNFTSDTFSRFVGLEELLDNAQGKSVLDLGCNESLISYEFARNGARLIHGLEKDFSRVVFGKRLFRDVAIEHRVETSDFSHPPARLDQEHAWLLPKYDMVLFLGVYHHLTLVLDEAGLRAFLDWTLAHTSDWYGLRTNLLPDIEPHILSQGFEKVAGHDGEAGKLGVSGIYRRA